MSSAFFLVSYDPLITSKAGRDACRIHKLPPFIDGSIRREPDLAHRYPSISCLCRAGKFAPRLHEGDFVAYVTNKHGFGYRKSQRHLTAILRVYKIFKSHRAAAKWYRDRGLRLPANCCVRTNPPQPLEMTHRIFDSSTCAGDAQTLAEWDGVYRSLADADETRRFVVCKKLWRDLSCSAPKVSDSKLRKAFGRIPGLENPKKWELSNLKSLLRLLPLDVSIPNEPNTNITA